MQPVNDDMDHLFRQAANDYPLNTQGADFDKLQQRMETADSNEVPVKKGRKQRFAWLLLLLLPLPFVCEHVYQNQVASNEQLAMQQAGRINDTTTQHSLVERPTVPMEDSASGNLATANNNLPAVSQKTTTLPAEPTQKETVAKQPHSTNRNLKNAGNDNTVSKDNLPLSNKKRVAKKVFITNTKTVLIKKRKYKNDANTYEANQSKDKQLQDITVAKRDQKPSFDKWNLNPSGIGSSTAEKDSLGKKTASDNTQAGIAQNDSATTGIAKITAVKDSSMQDTTAQKKQFTKTVEQGNYFYAGVVIGPDYSVVKSTRTGNTGYNTGIVAGYHFARHWAVETGLLWNHKSYYSDGQYISTEKLMLPAHMQVLHINGYCDLFEIPLSVQYHFSSKSKGHWYVATGLSSYLMKHEEYYYLYKRYNMDYYGKKDYSNSAKNWFSVLQLSGGYQLKTGKQGNLRIEPYFKLPISKIGIAELPLSSTGINIGYLKSF